MLQSLKKTPESKSWDIGLVNFGPKLPIQPKRGFSEKFYLNESYLLLYPVMLQSFKKILSTESTIGPNFTAGLKEDFLGNFTLVIFP